MRSTGARLQGSPNWSPSSVPACSDLGSQRGAGPCALSPVNPGPPSSCPARNLHRAWHLPAVCAPGVVVAAAGGPGFVRAPRWSSRCPPPHRPYPTLPYPARAHLLDGLLRDLAFGAGPCGREGHRHGRGSGFSPRASELRLQLRALMPRSGGGGPGLGESGGRRAVDSSRSERARLRPPRACAKPRRAPLPCATRMRPRRAARSSSGGLRCQRLPSRSRPTHPTPTPAPSSRWFGPIDHGPPHGPPHAPRRCVMTLGRPGGRKR